MTARRTRSGLLGLLGAASWGLGISVLPASVPAEGLSAKALVAEAAPRNAEAERLLSMLSVIPQSTTFHFRLPMVTYADYRAAEKAAGVAGPGSRSVLIALSPNAFARWASAMSRLRGDPRLGKADPLDLEKEVFREEVARTVPGTTSVFRALPELLGVDWFAIDRVVSFGPPDTPGIVVGGGPDLIDRQDLQAALSAQDFDSRKFGESSIWHRFDDGEVRSSAMVPADVFGQRPADPFLIGHGRAARIVALDGLLAGSPTWTLTEAIVATARGGLPSLRDVPAFQAMAKAITDPAAFKGVLVQAVFFEHIFSRKHVSLAKLGPYSSQERRDQLVRTWEERHPLPRYELAVLADRQEGETEVVLIGLVYGDASKADAAAAVLADRMAAFQSVQFRVRPVEDFQAKVNSRVYAAEEDGKAVALVSLRYVPKPEAESRLSRGKLFRVLKSAFYQGDADPLIVTATLNVSRVIIIRAHPAYTVFIGIPEEAPDRRVREIVDGLPAYASAVVLTGKEFTSKRHSFVNSTIIMQEYEKYNVADAIYCLVAKAPTAPWGITWNGGIALTRNDYQHAEKTYRSYQEDPESYEGSAIREPHTQEAIWDPINPGAFLPEFGCM